MPASPKNGFDENQTSIRIYEYHSAYLKECKDQGFAVTDIIREALDDHMRKNGFTVPKRILQPKKK